MLEQVFWSADRLAPQQVAPQPLPAALDVAIIGGGITGLAAARDLARAGLNVGLFDTHYPGWGASSRNGGMVLTGLKLDASTLMHKYGLACARRLFNASLVAIDAVEQLVREERIDCNFERSGHLVVAAKPGHMEGLRAEHITLQQYFGHPTGLVEQGVLASEIGTEVYYGGLVDERSAALNPARYVYGLARAAAGAGATLYGATTVQKVQRKNGGFVVATDRGTLRATNVLVASGGYTGRATPRLRRKIFALGSYVIATEPLPPALANELIPQGRMVFDTRHLLSYYRLTPDRRMLFGGRAAFFPESPRTVRESAGILRREMVRVFPQLAHTPIAYAWGGTLDASFDLMPHSGEQNGVYYALGYAGHGVALATYLGRLLAAQMLGRSVDNPFATIAFPGAPLGLYRGQPWFLPFAGLWYRWLDWVG
jgi:glycine/D-amino acid oxidase-like deaminating enzyme